jgi:hypothetical protein
LLIKKSEKTTQSEEVGTYLKSQSQESEDTMTCLPTAGFKIQELGFVALEACWHGLLRTVVDEFADIKGSG